MLVDDANHLKNTEAQQYMSGNIPTESSSPKTPKPELKSPEQSLTSIGSIEWLFITKILKIKNYSKIRGVE